MMLKMKSVPRTLLLATFFTVSLISNQCECSPVEKSHEQQCMEELGVSRVEVETNLENPKVKCVLACMMKKVNLIEDDKIVLDRVLESFMPKVKKEFGEREKNLIDCTKTANEQSNVCETAMSMFQCISKIPAT